MGQKRDKTGQTRFYITTNKLYRKTVKAYSRRGFIGAFNRNRTDDLEGLAFVSLPRPRAFSPAEGRSSNDRPLYGALRALRKEFL